MQAEAEPGKRMPYALRHFILAFVFIASAFIFALAGINPAAHQYNGLSAAIQWACFAAFVWHLTKAFFFIDTEEV
jgi:hypothetical protein